MNDREACIILNMVSGIGSARMQALLNRFETPANIFAQSSASIAGVKGIGQELAEKIANWRSGIDLCGELEMAEKGGAKIITVVDREYPAILREIYDPPICLYVRGTLPDFSSNTLAVVGSRRMTAYGRKMAAHLTEAAVYAGWKIISGLAYGVDAVAHQVAVDLKGITVAVLGGGLARVHPQDHVPLARRIVENNGALISEYPMRFPVSRQSFPRRNRIVSGLSRAVLVVEAGVDSGALITAATALEQGRSVFAVPGMADNPQARGCHKLIKEGAKLTEDFEDILQDFEFLPGFGGVKEQPREYLDESGEDDAAIPVPDTSGMSEEEQKIIRALALESKSFDALSSETGIAAGTLLGALMKMEIKKQVLQTPGKIYSLRR
ncbi:MAG: DNA-processing protein DprA [Victivallaceae bacterium]